MKKLIIKVYYNQRRKLGNIKMNYVAYYRVTTYTYSVTENLKMCGKLKRILHYFQEKGREMGVMRVIDGHMTRTIFLFR